MYTNQKKQKFPASCCFFNVVVLYFYCFALFIFLTPVPKIALFISIFIPCSLINNIQECQVCFDWFYRALGLYRCSMGGASLLLNNVGESIDFKSSPPRVAKCEIHVRPDKR